MSKTNQPAAQEDNKFQLERIALFSDAVFAIAITLLIIEIRIPELHSDRLTDSELLQQLLPVTTKLIGFLISFFVIGLYWFSHHRMFGYVIRTNHRLLWNNLLFLLPIVIMPFSTSFLSEYYFNSNLRIPLAVYTATISLSGYFSFRLWKIIGNPVNHLSEHLPKEKLSYNITRSLTIPIVFICALLFSLVNIKISYFILPLAPLVTGLIKAWYAKKYPAMKDAME
ncbi:DUF1211 domain-containing protein [Pedobacter sp. HDW13]|uniref:TMEM175 family protein n=1 Tax=unclassified Pedobacter TaxID=2628915 RepID=UPI000F590AFA|nr:MULTISPECIES: TMEM175 family protein [unclassified Pedobacter]QIL41640.1 DUF1211 domain-containing protein [Pedobacter sp. HDW13]RQO64758.1 hypothetical protein DBR40_24935 [Pedobacter sp. KBW01]